MKSLISGYALLVAGSFAHAQLPVAGQASIARPANAGMKVMQVAPYNFSPASARDIGKDGLWFKDAQGRYVLLRGVNFGSRSKRPPYLPILPLSATSLDATQVDAELAAVRPELQRLRGLGVNVIRLPVIWKALEPTPNPNLETLLPAGRTYLEMLKKVVDELYAKHGMFVLIDFHQDIAHEIYGGDGFPDWAIGIDRGHPQLKAEDLKNAAWGLLYYDNPTPFYLVDDGVRNTLRSFWANSVTNTEFGLSNFPVRTHAEKTLGRVAEFFKGHPAIIGYEPFNEPHPVGLSKSAFESQMIAQYYRNAAMEINRFDDRVFIFIEPRMDWTTYDASATELPIPAVSSSGPLTFTHNPATFLDASGFGPVQSRLVFSFHYYDPWLLTGAPFSRSMKDQANDWPPRFALLQSAGATRNMIPFLTEFGCSQDWQDNTDLAPAAYQHRAIRACMDLQYQQVEARLLNATYWNFDLYNTATDKDNWNKENFSVLGPNRSPRELDIVARTYPMRSSAKPTRISFDVASKNAAVVLAGPAVDAPTVIFVPRAMQYPGDDFEVRATTPPSSVQWDEAQQLLYWWPDKTRAQNQIIISKTGGFGEWLLPAESRALVPQTTYRMILGRQKPVPVPPPPALTIKIEQVSKTATTRTIRVLAFDSNTGASVNGSVTIDGVAVGNTGAPVTYKPKIATVTEYDADARGKPKKTMTKEETSEIVVTAPGYPAATMSTGD
jgi:aryl-phospho-beta-D-glucosidase BglC (GH1 family)